MILDRIATMVAFLVLLLGVPSRMKYAWQATKIRRLKSARDVSRKFYLVSWVVYIIQLIHNILRRDWVDATFWAVGVFTVAFCIVSLYQFWHEPMPLGRWIIDSFTNPEEGSFWR